MMRICRLLGVVTIPLLVLVPLGCGKSSSIQFKGKLVLPEKLTLAKDDVVRIQFLTEDPKAMGAVATVSNSDLSFTLKAADHKGGPFPGKYKVLVTIFSPEPPAQSKEKVKDSREEILRKLTAEYGGRNSKLNYEVSSDQNQSV